MCACVRVYDYYTILLHMRVQYVRTCVRTYVYVRAFERISVSCVQAQVRRGTCLRRPLGTRRPPRLFEKLESYCIKLASLITRYSVLIYCAKEKHCKISSRKDLQTER